MAGMRYIPALDGLRAVAIVLVLLFHARAPFGLGGFVGVDVFFVLSGFLITSLLLGEYAARGTVSLRSFYWRRAVRLCPALFALLAVYLLVAPIVWPGAANHGLESAVAGLYLSDYAVAFLGIPQFIGHTWSLSVEEHFYLLWPLVLLWACRRFTARQLVIGLAVAWVAATLWRAACVADGQSWQLAYYRFDTRLSGLLLGALLAALARDPAALAGVRRYMPRAVLWLPLALLAGYRFRWGAMEVLVWGLPVIELCTLAVLMEIQRAGGLSRVLAHPSLVWLGKMSYGVYLWHYPIMRVMRDDYPWEFTLLAGTALSIGMAALSFYTIEAWAKRSRRLFGAHAVEA
jgi:peptidoglycan/LPS O-acetylase OafA/YrhL